MSNRTSWSSVLMVYRAFGLTKRDLLDFIDFESEAGFRRAYEFLFGSSDDKKSPENFWLLLFTLLANYTSMNQTLIDHVRNLMRQFPESNFTREEAERRLELANQPVTRFVKDLRNYITHNTAPPLAMNLALRDGATFSATSELEQVVDTR